MSKPICIISCPIDTYSGYGARSRDFVKSLIKTKGEEWDIKILSQRWGQTPFGFLENENEIDLKSRIIGALTTGLPSQPEVWIQITVPNEFQPVGKFNIGLTAGIETTGCHPSWIEGCNKMNLVLTSSTHSADVFKKIEFEQRDQRTNQVVNKYTLQKPVEVLIEGVDLETYGPKKSDFDLSQIKEEFAYLFVGHWMQGNLSHDRKNVGLLIKLFFEAFKNKKNTPALILKTTCVGASYMDRDEILRRIDMIRKSVDARSTPNVYLVHGELTDEEMNELYNHSKVKAMISLTKGEGFGRPLLEFSLTKKPIIATNWSGHTDFLSEDFVTLLPGELHNLDDSSVVQDMLMKEFQWFGVDNSAAFIALRDVFADYKEHKEKANRQAFRSRTEFSFEKMAEQLDGYLTQYVPEFPKQVQLKLPQLKKIELPKFKKIENVEG
jgi:glycosyltransferase involved in cell wall biosynthesis